MEPKKPPRDKQDSSEAILELDLERVPFSRKGSYLAISWLDPSASDPRAKEGLYLRHLRAGGKGPVFLLEPVANNKPVPYEIRATPTHLRLHAYNGEVPHGVIEFCFPFPNQLQFRILGSKLGLRLTMLTGSYDHATPISICTQDPEHESPENLKVAWEINSYTHSARFLLVPLQGELIVDAPWNGLECEHIEASFRTISTPGVEPKAEGVIQDYVAVIESLENGQPLALGEGNPFQVLSWTESLKRVQEDFDIWNTHCPSIESNPDLQKARSLASYITWSCVVEKEGFLPKPAMYMSKNWMANVWSWDHCFNAMALFYKNPALAWEQFCLFFDRQHPSGALPDYMNDKWASWNCCKPPIHGWTLKWMIERDETGFLDRERFSQVYVPLVLWTEWWFKHRDYDMDGIPQYNHGNDSGWDNSTVFFEGVPVESPDLCAFLVIQMEVLSYIAMRLGREDERRMWLARAHTLLEKTLKHFWNEEEMQAALLKPQGTTWVHQRVKCDSLLPHLAIVLGERLPDHVRKWIVSELEKPGNFLTPHGLATEKITSPRYEADGYWRGPIWAPSTMLIVDGLMRIGETALAQDIAQRFCYTAANSGMAENFEATTGEALQDPAFTWTSSVYMILAHEYV